MLDPGLPSRRSGEGGTGAENGVANGRQPGSPTEGRGGNVAPRQGGVANGRQPGSPTEGGGSIDPRQEFLEAYDAATLQLCNRLFEREASCIADTGFREVAPWNRVPGYLVRPCCCCCLQSNIFNRDLIKRGFGLSGTLLLPSLPYLHTDHEKDFALSGTV
jgi:hypothetical protein